MTNVQINDTELVIEFRNGNDKAFETLLRRHKTKVYNTIYLIVKDADVAQDLLQDCFIKAVDHIRLGKYNEDGTANAIPGHNLTLSAVGAFILWFGWFGFNAGSALLANGLAAQALVNTHLAAASGMLAWLLVEKLRAGHATTLGAASGAVAGLVAITPCAGFVGGAAPIIIGLVAGAVCYLALTLKTRFNFDDSLDVIAVHLVGGIIGALLLGLFADTKVNSLGFDGVLFGGGSKLLVNQLIAIGATFVFSFVVTWVVAKILDATIGLRVNQEDELVGLDQSQHAESAYQ